MRFLQQICLNVVHLTKQLWTLSKAFATGSKGCKQEVTWSEAEAERLDRIRHPEKYLGK